VFPSLPRQSASGWPGAVGRWCLAAESGGPARAPRHGSLRHLSSPPACLCTPPSHQASNTFLSLGGGRGGGVTSFICFQQSHTSSTVFKASHLQRDFPSFLLLKPVIPPMVTNGWRKELGRMTNSSSAGPRTEAAKGCEPRVSLRPFQNVTNRQNPCPAS